jgi:hypothetical protein
MVSSINEVDQNVVYLTSFVTDTSSSMVEMSASIAQVETNAARSYDLAIAVSDAAESGMKAVRETIEGMEQIRQSVIEANTVVARLGDRSVAIGKILNVIEDVAEQTNLLALNAAISRHAVQWELLRRAAEFAISRAPRRPRATSRISSAQWEEVQNALKAVLVRRSSRTAYSSLPTRARRWATSPPRRGVKHGQGVAGATREQTKKRTVTRAVDRLQSMVGQIQRDAPASAGLGSSSGPSSRCASDEVRAPGDGRASRARG